jgi:site-specific DNA-cytosine methylase
LPASLYHHGTVVNQDVDSGHLVLSDLPKTNEEQTNNPMLFQATRNENIRIFEKHSPTLAVAGWLRSLSVFSMHGAMIGRSDEAGPKGSGFLGDNEPSYTLTASSQARHGVVIAPTLSASNNPSRSPQSSEITAQVEAMVKETGVVRRLTPLECERLQGFPDGWTEGQADGHRYKQLGNAVAVPVVSWIIKRLVKVVGEAQ